MKINIFLEKSEESDFEENYLKIDHDQFKKFKKIRPKHIQLSSCESYWTPMDIQWMFDEAEFNINSIDYFKVIINY